MPPWSDQHSGTLNDEQIRQLSTLINQGDEHAWEFAIEQADHADNINGLNLSDAIDEADTRVRVSQVSAIGAGVRLEIDQELMLVQEVDTGGGFVTVERGLGRTSPASHDAGATVLLPPVPPDPPAITGELNAVCGQRARAVATAAPEPPQTALTISAQAIAWNKVTLLAVAGQPLTITVNNNDAGVPHNWVLFGGADETGDRLAETPIETGVIVQTLDFGPLAAGDYFYWCDVHPNMQGLLTAQEAQAAQPTQAATEPTPTPTP
jgi:hypothetical protein